MAAIKDGDQERVDVNALCAALAMASANEVDKALKNFAKKHPEHSPFASSLRGPMQIIRSASETVVASGLKEAKAQREFMRRFSTADIEEMAVRQPLMEEDIWAPGLFASGSAELVTEPDIEAFAGMSSKEKKNQRQGVGMS